MKENTSKETKRYSHINLEEREEIAIWLENGKKQYEIAKLLCRNPGTISRELKRNSPPKNTVKYRANRAQLLYEERKKHSRIKKRIPNKNLRRFIINKLLEGYSPEIIAYLAFQKNGRWKTNHESICQWIYIEHRELIPFLTRGHKKRRKRSSGKKKRCRKVPNRVIIEKRPEYINMRSKIGHWETDTIISRQSKAAVMVLVERRTRYVILKKLSAKTALYMHKAEVKSLSKFKDFVRRSITYDNGTENSLHELTNQKLRTKSYFCNPYHSWEKGTVENIIGLVRRFYPKKTDWKKVSQCDLNKVSSYINNRPMKLHGFKTPYQVFVALTA